MIHVFQNKKSIIPFLFHACQRYFTPVGSELQWSPDLLKGFRTTLAFSKTVNTPNTWSRWNAQTIIRIHLLTSVFFQLGTYISFHPAENQKHCCCLRGRAINPQLLLQFKEGCAGLCFLSIWKWKTINYDDGDGNGTPPQKMDLGGNGGTPRSGTPCSKKTKKQSWHILHIRREKIVSLHQKSLFDTILTFSFGGRVALIIITIPREGGGANSPNYAPLPPTTDAAAAYLFTVMMMMMMLIIIIIIIIIMNIMTKIMITMPIIRHCTY